LRLSWRGDGMRCMRKTLEISPEPDTQIATLESEVQYLKDKLQAYESRITKLCRGMKE